MSRSRKSSVRILLGIVGVVCLGPCAEFLNAYDGLPSRVVIPPAPRIEPMRIRWYRMDDGVAGRASTIANSMARMAGKANPDCALVVVPWDSRNELVPPMKLGLPDHTRVDVIFDHDRDAILRRARSIGANVVLEARPRIDFPSNLGRLPARDFSGDPDDVLHRFRPCAPPLPPVPSFGSSNVGALGMPAPTFPKIEIPKIQIPKIERIQIPKIEPIEMPRFEMPKIERIEMPRFEMPRIEPIEMPRFEMPRFDVPYSAFP